MMDVLKHKGRMTRILLLLEIVTGSPKEQRTLAEPVGITPQAVSEYLSKMREEGMVTTGPEGPRATVKGVDLLHHDLLAIKEFVDTSIGDLDIIRSTDAIARDEIGKGQTVFLVMDDGLLYASLEGFGSSGTADSEASPGEMVAISGLSGLVEMEMGIIRFIEIEPARSGGGKGTVTEKEVISLCGVCDSPYRIAALDLEGVALLKRSDLRYDLELPPPEAVVEVSMRGLDVIAIGTPFSVSRIVGSLERRSGKYKVERSSLKGLSS